MDGPLSQMVGLKMEAYGNRGTVKSKTSKSPVKNKYSLERLLKDQSFFI